MKLEVVRSSEQFESEVKMDNLERETCMKFGSSANQLTDNVEMLIDDMLYGEEISEHRLKSLKMRIEHMRKFEKDYKIMLGIKKS